MVPVSPPPPGSSVSWSLNRPGGIRRNPAAARRPTLPGRQCGGESRVPGGRAHVGLGKNIPTSSVSRTRCSPMRPTGRKECGRSPAHSETSTPRYLQARGPPASDPGPLQFSLLAPPSCGGNCSVQRAPVGEGDKQTEFKSLCVGVSFLASLSLPFLVCNMEILMTVLFPGLCEIISEALS
ncbi:PREDICTED: uncharacterized protein LOC106727822 isoform X3 [Myotis brandtii]|uniref:uncharacterized protein LOC106727822 isoform X3 n=1 Tax=Myotis brandtii TaxID=109478 RepID=UPI00070478FD|nr:PREDICTED: uncharacterized protein LOC106727822 isoform X3 [Myotis brandtii]